MSTFSENDKDAKGQKGAYFENEDQPKIINKELLDILITFGGSDPFKMTEKIIQILGKSFLLINHLFLIGPGYKNIDLLFRYRKKNIIFHWNCSGDQMIRLMRGFDIVI